MNTRQTKSGITLLDVVIALVVVCVVLTLWLPALQNSREDQRQTTCAVRMKNLTTAFHYYHDNFGRLPASAFYGDGQNLGDKKTSLKKVVPGHGGIKAAHAPYSFHVQLLPYIEQKSIYDEIDFKQREAFDRGNQALAAKAVPLFNCPSFQGEQHSSAKEYETFAADGPRPALSQYKALGATTLDVLQNAEQSTAVKGDGGVLTPYAALSFAALRAPNQTLILCETREARYAAWWDGTTSSIPGFVGSRTKSMRPALATTPGQEPFLAKKSFGGEREMQWGPSSEHPNQVNHSYAGTEVAAINIDIDPKTYAALITRRTDDNGVLEEFFNRKAGPANLQEVEPKRAEPRAPEQARTWRDASGRTVEAEFVELKDDKVILRRSSNGKILNVPLSKLSEADQEYVRQAAPTRP